MWRGHAKSSSTGLGRRHRSRADAQCRQAARSALCSTFQPPPLKQLQLFRDACAEFGRPYTPTIS